MNEKLCHVLHYLVYLGQSRNWPTRTWASLVKSVIFSEIASLHYLRHPLTSTKLIKTANNVTLFQAEEHFQWLLNTKRIGQVVTVAKPVAAKYESLIAPDVSGFSQQELEIISEMGDTCCKRYTGVVLIDLTRNYTWEILKVGEVINPSAYLSSDRPSDGKAAKPAGLDQEDLDDIDRILKENPL